MAGLESADYTLFARHFDVGDVIRESFPGWYVRGPLLCVCIVLRFLLLGAWLLPNLGFACFVALAFAPVWN